MIRTKLEKFVNFDLDPNFSKIVNAIAIVENFDKNFTYFS